MNADTREEIRRSGFVAFRQRNYTIFVLAQFFGGMAVEMQATAVLWQVWKLTDDPFALGLVGLAQITPFFALFIVSGMMADRLPRKYILIGCLSLHALCGATFYFITTTGVATFWIMFVILLGVGTARALQAPAQKAIVAILVPGEHLGNAIAWSTSSFNAARITAPGVAGLVLIAGIDLVYAIAVAFMLLAIGLLTMLRINTQILSSEPITVSTLLAGLKFITSRRVIMGTISLDMFAVLLGGARALLPIYATDILEVGASGFGLLRAADTVGSLACFLVLTQFPVRRHAGNKMLITVILYGCGILVFGLSTNFVLSLAALCFMGATDAISMFIRSNLIQIVPPDNLRGRVNAVNGVFTNASGQVGEFESGVTAAWFGTVPAVIFGGAATITVALLFVKYFPQLRKVDSLDAEDLIARFRDTEPARTAPQAAP